MADAAITIHLAKCFKIPRQNIEFLLGIHIVSHSLHNTDLYKITREPRCLSCSKLFLLKTHICSFGFVGLYLQGRKNKSDMLGIPFYSPEYMRNFLPHILGSTSLVNPWCRTRMETKATSNTKCKKLETAFAEPRIAFQEHRHFFRKNQNLKY